MRYVLVLVILLLAACEGSFVRSGDLGRKVNIDKSYEARDACLARNALADGTSAEDPTMLAHAVALACSAETDKLIAASDLSGDAKVANQIRQDSGFRPLGFVMKARSKDVKTELPGVYVIDIQRKEDPRGFVARVTCVDEFATHGFSLQPFQANIA